MIRGQSLYIETDLKVNIMYSIVPPPVTVYKCRIQLGLVPIPVTGVGPSRAPAIPTGH